MPTLAPASSKAPVDLTVLGGFGNDIPQPQTKPGFYFYGQRTLGEDKNTEGQDVPVLKWTASAQPKVLTLDAMGVKVVWPDDNDGNSLFESFRITHPETIHDPDNPDTSVDVDVIDQVGLKKKNGNTVFTYDYTEGGGT
jgi:hypothetical protein